MLLLMPVCFSSGLFFEKHLKYIKLNDLFVPFTKMDLNYLLKVSDSRSLVVYIFLKS